MCFAERSVAIVPEHVERLTAFDAYTRQSISQELYPFVFGFLCDFAFALLCVVYAYGMREMEAADLDGGVLATQ
jgi:hypothetical protein